MNESEWLFYIGITLMGCAGVFFLLFTAILGISGKRLERKLEQEFGKRHR